MKIRNTIFATLSILLGTTIVLLLSEIALRFLPVHDSFMAMPVSAAEPVFHFTPNREATWSRDWDLDGANTVRINNAGYVNDQDYDANDPRPLLAVVGDSYVEAAMVPYRETLQGRLAAAVAPEARAYSFAAAGAPLSQYLIWAREARDHWKAQALVIVVVGNDFDESLAIYHTAPGFYQYVANDDGTLKLWRHDYQPGRLQVIARHSAIARYLLLNLHLIEHLAPISNFLSAIAEPAHAQPYVANTSVDTNTQRVRLSEAAVDAFLRDLSTFSGWRPEQVVFVVDGIRYPTDNPVVAASYFVHMRTFFIAQARLRGYEAIDMDSAFFARFQATRERYDFSTDQHWNGLAHGLAANAVLQSRAVANWRRENGRMPVNN